MISFSTQVGEDAFLKIMFEGNINKNKIDYSGNGFIVSGLDQELKIENPNFSFWFSRDIDGWDTRFPITISTENEFVSSFLDDIGQIILGGIKEYEGYHRLKISSLS